MLAEHTRCNANRKFHPRSQIKSLLSTAWTRGPAQGSGLPSYALTLRADLELGSETLS